MGRGNGDGSIYKLSGKRRRPWAVRVTTGWTLEGKRMHKYVGYYRTKTEAKDALMDYLTNPYDLSNKNVKLMDVFKEWYENTDLAEKFRLEVKATVDTLKENPNRGSKHYHGARKIMYKKYMIIYKVHGSTVYIIGVD